MPDIRIALANYRARLDDIRRLYPDESEDDLADTFSGEAGDLESAILASLRDALYREAQAEAVEHMIDRLRERQSRFKNTAQATRAAALQAMQEANIPKLPAAPDMSVSIGRGKPKVLIVDEALIPLDLCRVRYEPNKKAIAEKLAAGEEVPGVTQGNPQPFLTIHRR